MKPCPVCLSSFNDLDHHIAISHQPILNLKKLVTVCGKAKKQRTKNFSIKVDFKCDMCTYPCNDEVLMNFHKANNCPRNSREPFQAVFIEENIVKTELDLIKTEIEYILP